MSAPLVSIVEGWTGALPFTLKADGTPIDLTGLTVRIVLKDNTGTIVKNTTAGITVTASTIGQLEYAPASSSGDLFVASRTPYRIRFSLTDATPRTVYHPNDEEELIEVNAI